MLFVSSLSLVPIIDVVPDGLVCVVFWWLLSLHLHRSKASCVQFLMLSASPQSQQELEHHEATIGQGKSEYLVKWRGLCGGNLLLYCHLPK